VAQEVQDREVPKVKDANWLVGQWARHKLRAHGLIVKVKRKKKKKRARR